MSVGSTMQVPMCANRFERYAKGALEDLTIADPAHGDAVHPLAPGGLMGAVGLRPPVGVVACITPYNFPITNDGRQGRPLPSPPATRWWSSPRRRTRSR